MPVQVSGAEQAHLLQDGIRARKGSGGSACEPGALEEYCNGKRLYASEGSSDGGGVDTLVCICPAERMSEENMRKPFWLSGQWPWWPPSCVPASLEHERSKRWERRA
jgi:hypothetical protein